MAEGRATLHSAGLARQCSFVCSETSKERPCRIGHKEHGCACVAYLAGVLQLGLGRMVQQGSAQLVFSPQRSGPD